MASVSWQNASWTYTEAHSRKLRDYVYVGSFLPLNTVVELPVFKTSGSERKYGSAIYAVSKASEPHERTNSWPEADAGYSQPQEGWRALRVALICGGPSAERGISLNSARSVLDHLQSEDVAISCYYIDQNFLPYRISLAQLYSNTPSDFDYKVSSMAEGFESVTALMNHLCRAADIVFPLIHGRFGEDGGIQELLEGAGIPYIGTSAAAARRAFDKYSACSELSRGGFATIPSFLVVKDPARDRSAVTSWFEANGLDINAGRVVVKPAVSGSSIGVTVAHGVEKAVEQAEILISEGLGERIVIEVFIEDGREFTAIVIDMGSPGNPNPVTLLPTEVELCNELLAAKRSDAIFSYRQKYLPTNQVVYHTPPRFPREAIQAIRSGAAEAFKQLQLCDFARIDGWLLPHSTTYDVKGNRHRVGDFEAGRIVFTDINLVSGMEQTSFLFQQFAQVGISHAGALRMILLHACRRYPSLSSFWSLPSLSPKTVAQNRRQKVHVIFGGDTSERQVSLLSGTNVMLNLRKSSDLDVIPILLSSYCSKMEGEGSFSNSMYSKTIWKLPYALLLRHTVEEVVEACMKAAEPSTMAASMIQRDQLICELQAAGGVTNITDISFEAPRQLTMSQWISEVKNDDAVVFIAVHGGVGENGNLQEILQASNIAYTGSGVAASRICMDKAVSATALAHLTTKGVLTAPKDVWSTADILKETRNWSTVWESMLKKMNAQTLCVKPASDGCSTGVARLCSAKDLHLYLDAIQARLPQLLPGSLSKAHGIIQMPDSTPEKLIFEPFIETAEIRPSSGNAKDKSAPDILEYTGSSKWVEITVGVIGRAGEMHALNPSITIKEQSDILSLEEKFQGGTGINLTPPPPSLIGMDAVQACKKRVELVANTLQLEGFARIDAFVHIDSGEIIVIEVNTIPGMTPSTVLVHQALAEVPPIFPAMFFRSIVELALSRHKGMVIYP